MTLQPSTDTQRLFFTKRRKSRCACTADIAALTSQYDQICCETHSSFSCLAGVCCLASHISRGSASQQRTHRFVPVADLQYSRGNCRWNNKDLQLVLQLKDLSSIAAAQQGVWRIWPPGHHPQRCPASAESPKSASPHALPYLHGRSTEDVIWGFP